MRTFWALLFAAGVIHCVAAEQQAPPAQVAMIGAGWMAHLVCSGVFVSGRTVESVMGAEFGPGSDAGQKALVPEV